MDFDCHFVFICLSILQTLTHKKPVAGYRVALSSYVHGLDWELTIVLRGVTTQWNQPRTPPFL